ncbi:MAG: ABC transporter substrate-binding protein [Alistipes sp.]|nr:ABC transporter substrate-binding protein [Alistipes sp.]
MKKKKTGIFFAIACMFILTAVAAGCAGNDKTDILSDGEYRAGVELLGGSGKAKIESPARLTVKDGKMTLEVVWNSSNYTYMKVDGITYYAEGTGENSTFLIPVAAFEEEIPFAAETVAMSTPHEIQYSMIVHKDVSDGEKKADRTEEQSGEERTGETFHVEGLVYDHSMELEYAKGFCVDYYEGGFALITISDSAHFLVVPENGNVPETMKITDDEGREREVVVLRQPVTDIYLAATSAMNLFDALESISAVSLTSTDKDGWYIGAAKEALENGSIRFVGKYSEPDYEVILAEGCELAVESNMISHAPQVKEKLEEIGVPVLVDMSSYEEHPLGRSEWIKLYGVLFGKEEQARQLFAEQVSYLRTVESGEKTGKTAAFFYINSNGSVVTRKKGDYIAKMIELAGGTYLFGGDGEKDDGSSTLTLEMETFYAVVRDADYIIYNSSIAGELGSIEELVAKNPLLADCKAVRNKNMWCTTKSLYQETLHLGVMIDNLHTVFTGDTNEITDLDFLYKLR